MGQPEMDVHVKVGYINWYGTISTCVGCPMFGY